MQQIPQPLFHIPENHLRFRVGHIVDGGWQAHLNRSITVEGEIDFLGAKRVITAPSFLAGSVMAGAAAISQIPYPVEFSVEANLYAIRDTALGKMLEVVSERPLREGLSILDGVLKRRVLDGKLYLQDPLQREELQGERGPLAGVEVIAIPHFVLAEEHLEVESLIGGPIRDIAHSVELQSTLLAIIEHELQQQQIPSQEGFFSEYRSGPLERLRAFLRKINSEPKPDGYVCVEDVLTYFNPEAKTVVLEALEVLSVRQMIRWVYLSERIGTLPGRVGLTLAEL